MKITMYGAVVGVGMGWAEARELIDSWIEAWTHEPYEWWFIDDAGYIVVVIDYQTHHTRLVGMVE